MHIETILFDKYNEHIKCKNMMNDILACRKETRL